MLMALVSRLLRTELGLVSNKANMPRDGWRFPREALTGSLAGESRQQALQSAGKNVLILLVSDYRVRRSW